MVDAHRTARGLRTEEESMTPETRDTLIRMALQPFSVKELRRVLTAKRMLLNGNILQGKGKNARY